VKETTMLKIVLGAIATLVLLALPSKANAYGAAHVGYTHVGANGVYHTGRTAAYGPGGAYAGGHTGAYGYGGASYHSGGAYHAGYRYTPGYGGAAGYRYGYVR
jgi:hypothetical protein